MIKVVLDVILKEKKITAKELCEHIGLTEANMSILRSGKAKAIRFDTLNAICKYLNCQPNEILIYEDENNEKIINLLNVILFIIILQSCKLSNDLKLDSNNENKAPNRLVGFWVGLSKSGDQLENHGLNDFNNKDKIGYHLTYDNEHSMGVYKGNANNIIRNINEGVDENGSNLYENYIEATINIGLELMYHNVDIYFVYENKDKEIYYDKNKQSTVINFVASSSSITKNVNFEGKVNSYKDTVKVILQYCNTLTKVVVNEMNEENLLIKTIELDLINQKEYLKENEDNYLIITETYTDNNNIESEKKYIVDKDYIVIQNSYYGFIFNKYIDIKIKS